MNLRKSLPEDHTVFLAYIGNQAQVRLIKPTTVTNILKNMMANAGIDTNKFGPRSIRSASSTKAVQLGHKIEEIKKHAN
ncbi:uncharacterized protein B0P05DRAFT_632010 [Gilbertella persicaria]|uniref:uncharacterized protein n=1 Tax=Gilbertella persicaria TaxID=101096 RepID=UPI00221F6325|nr:uncharacterized protein B0P05DRAFT_632010 [Gilbertella persicaria]KAI8047292.1 hypothetical protein B0P05DRAFT_632010 [Gilbertella persicaria]